MASYKGCWIQERQIVRRSYVAQGLTGPVFMEPVAIRSGDLRWDRRDGEPVEAFRQRVAAEAPRDSQGGAVLYDCA